MTATVSQAPVHTVARYTLQCANEASVTSLESLLKLGPLDELVLPFVPVQNVFVYRKPPTSSGTKLLPTERLRQALPYLLDYYPHLTGRLQMNQETNAPEIVRLGTGAELHEARCELRLDDLVPPDRASSYLLKEYVGIRFWPSSTLAFGGVVLGIRLHHIVCDTGGYFQLVRDLAEIYRKLSSSSRPFLKHVPQIRSYLQDISILSRQERQEALDYKPTAYYVEQPTTSAMPTALATEESKAPTEFSQHVLEEPLKPPITGRVLRFTGNQLQELKRLATDPRGKEWVSTFEALCAYLYQRVYRARAQLQLSQGVSLVDVSKHLFRGFWASIDMRDRSRLNLGPNYFPNAIYPSYGVFSHELLTDGELWMVAKGLHDLIRGVDVQRMEQTTRWIAVQPDKSRIRVNFTFADGNFTVSQWSRFKMYVGVDFEVDENGNPVPPVLVAPPLTEISRVDALAIMLSTDEDLSPGAKESGCPSSIDVNLTLTDPLWSILDQDKQFQKYYR